MKLSIIVPVYNSEKYIEKTIDNILNQTYQDFELIMVDDNSKDGTVDKLREISVKDSRIKLLLKEENEGPSLTRNKGISEASGDYIVFIDADDEIEKDMFETINNELIKENTDVDVLVFGCIEEYYSNDKITYRHPITPGNEKYLSENEVHESIIQLEKTTLFGYPWNKAYRSEIIKENNIMFEDVWMIEDFLFNLEVFKHIRTMKSVDYMPYHYAIRNTTSVTSKFRKDYFVLHKRRVQELVNAYKDWNCLDREKTNYIAHIYSRYLLSAIEQNSDKRSELSNRERYIWLKKEMESDLFKELRPYMYSENRILKIVMQLFKNKKINTCLFLGKLLVIIKNKCPGLFSKVKQNR